MNARTVFCDRLTWRSAIALVKSRVASVRVLDDIAPARGKRWLRALLQVLGCRVIDTDFFAGHLREGDDEPIYIVASRRTSDVALAAARAVIAASPPLAAINEQVGRDRLALRIARQCWTALGRQVLQIHVAQALGRPAGAVLWLAQPTRYDPRVLQDVASGVEVRCYRAVNPLLERASMAGWVLVLALKDFYWRMASVLSSPPALRDVHGRPGVLLLKEDELSSDHSYRSQPHWFPDETEARLPFATYLIAAAATRRPPPGTGPSDLTILSARELGHIDRRITDPVATRLRREARRCLWMTLAAKPDWTRTGAAIAARLLLRGALLAKTCRALNVRAFLSGETYLLDSDALHSISRDINVTTLTYQYSNLPYGNVIAATTSDQMLLFAPRFERIWSFGGIRPQRFTPVGYPFDGAVARVRARSSELRRRLEDAGARFVVVYFDENAGPVKYGFTAFEELDDEIRTLARRVLDDPTLGVIFKSQFRRRSPTVRLAADPLLAAAIATGRMIDLYAGTHRNVVLPAEAALAADMALSQVVGATAALESALAGTRCVLVNHNGVRTANDELYARGEVVFGSFEDALLAIDRYRAGDARYGELGDWSPFLRELDPFGDGRSTARLREVLERIVCGGAPPREAPRTLEEEIHG